MLPKKLIKGFDKRRLKILLLLFFLGLAVPTAILVAQAYSQLKWEAFHQHRGAAEELTRRIDSRLSAMIRAADARSFADYTFLIVSGEPSANLVQRSPLSAYPVPTDLPGVMGYFQVDSEGAFSTPLLPPQGTDAATVGISDEDFDDRLALAQRIRQVLADNQLVQSRPDPGVRRGIDAFVTDARTGFDEEEMAPRTYGAVRGRQVETDALGEPEAEAPVATGGIGASNEGYSQQIFDQLNQPRTDVVASPAIAGSLESFDDAGEVSQAELRDRIGKVSDLNLDAALQKKSEEFEGEIAKERGGASAATPERAKRREKIALPEALPEVSELVADSSGPADLRISTFESEVDPFEFSLLDSGHFVLFRKVWRNGERYIQGLLVDQRAFISDVIGTGFEDTALSSMSNLIVAYNDDVIRTFSARDSAVYPDISESLDGALLYSSRLTAPLNSLQLIFSIQRLPPGAGASVLGWVTLVLAIVLVGGFVALYRLGSGQIDLARQQQDFVSAVSHELKTPLTSIRMYGEMLKEGWADEEKRQSYYEFIHEESERLSRLISNVLELAKITRNEPQFDLKPMSVGELMVNTESKISSQAQRAGFELRFSRAEDADRGTINVDDDCFTQIVINLVDNAIKFSKHSEHKVIEIGSRLAGNNQVMVSVRDYGPGVPSGQMQKIFQLFYRTESELTRETVGTGIGLAIVHQLTLAMNGRVDMINVEPGAEFRLLFPLVREPD